MRIGLKAHENRAQKRRGLYTLKVRTIRTMGAEPTHPLHGNLEESETERLVELGEKDVKEEKGCRAAESV